MGFFQKRAHAIPLKEALVWSSFWILLSLGFNLFVYFWHGKEAALSFLTGYLLEKSLSIDNLFVFLLIFRTFQVPPRFQHRVLFWGILGALLLRALFIFSGIALLKRFHFLSLLFGIFLIYTGARMLWEKERRVDPEKNMLLSLFRKLVPTSSQPHGGAFFVREEGKLLATSLLAVLLVVESTDLLFAVDSIPAILAVTQDPFIVYSSNVFAILGLRALYFALAGMVELFPTLHYGVSAILIFVGLKMLFADLLHIPTTLTLAVIAGILGTSLLPSLFLRRKR